MGFSLRNLWESSDFWDKEENARQGIARTSNAARKRMAPPAQTKAVDNRSNISKAFNQVNPFDSGKTFKQSQTSQQARTDANKVEREQAIALRDRFKSGSITAQQFNQGLQNTLNNNTQGGMSGFQKAILPAANSVANNKVLRPVLTGLSTLDDIYANTAGGLLAYGGRGVNALGGNADGLVEFGDKLQGLGAVDQQGDFANRGLGDTLISGGISLGGDLVNSLNPVTQKAVLAKYFTGSANDLAGNMEDAGYSPQASFGAGTALGGVNAGLEKLSLGTIGGKAGGAITSKLVSKLPQRLAGNAAARTTTRLVASGLTEGTTEGLQTVADNFASQKTYDPTRSLTEGVAQSVLAGGILGAGARGGVEIGTKLNTPTGLTDAQQQKRNVLVERYTKAQQMGKTAAMNQAAKEIDAIDNIGASPATRLKNKAIKPVSADGTRDFDSANTEAKTYKVFRGSGGNKQVKTLNDQSILGNDKKYYAFDKDTASKFGENIEESSVELSKPLILTNDQQWREISREAGNKYPSPTGLSKSETQAWSDNVVKLLESKGHDGVVVQMDKSGDNSKLLNSAFGSDQVVPFAAQSQPTPKPTPRVSKLQDALQGKSTKLGGQTKTQPQTAETSGVDQVASALGIEQSQATELKSKREKLSQGSSYANSIPEFTNQDASRPADIFNAVATNPNSRNAKILESAVNSSQEIQSAQATAEREGTEFNYYAEKGEAGRSVAINKFNPKIHTIKSGNVLDSDGTVIGNHVRVNPTGVEVNVGGEMVNMNNIIGDAKNIENSYKVGQTMERNIFRVFKDKAQASKVYKYVIANKLQNETNFRKELNAERGNLKTRMKDTMKAKPSGVNKKAYKEAVFNYIEGTTTRKDITAEYGTETVKQIDLYKKETRKVYDTLLTRVNKEFARFGEPEVAKRKDYLTHISELSNKTSFAGDMYGKLRNSALGEADGNTRKGVPGEISGRTGEFEPRKRWNPFFQQRKGAQDFKKDPFEAVDSYLEPTLYNIHMTESAVRARAVETAMRTAQKFESEFDEKTVKADLRDAFKEKFNDTNIDKVINGWQEYANALAGKTNALDRTVVDKMGDTGPVALKGWQTLQKIGGRATILGNAQSVLSQTLGIPSTIAHAGGKNTLVAVKKLATNDPIIEKSRFVQSRITNVNSPIRSNVSKGLDALGIPLQVVEQEFVKMTFYAEHEAALARGFKGDEAVVEADRMAERVVAGRGIADKPEIYRSTVANGVLQYTLEVNAQNQLFWKDLTPVQKGKYVAGAFVMNSILASVTGFEPLPDFLGATLDTIKDFSEDDEDDERSTVGKIGGTAQRFASEAANMNPFVMAGANILPQELRKDVFGQDSDVGRFDGQAAPVQVVERGIKGVKSLIEGDVQNAAEEVSRGFIPAGNQLRKTVTGAQALVRGHAVDGGNNPTFPVSADPINATKSLLFGPNSTSGARAYYDNKQGNITGKDDVKAIQESIQQSGNAAKTVQGIQDRRASGTSASGKTQDVQATGTDYDKIVDAYSKKGDGIKIGDYDTDELRETIDRVNTEAKTLLDQRGLEIGGVKLDSKFAEEYSRYKKNSEGKDEIAQSKATDTFLKSTVKSQLDDKTQSFYKLGDNDMRSRIQDGTISKAQMDKVIEIDNALTQAGLQKYPQVGKMLREELGYGLVSNQTSSSSSRSSSKGGRKSSGRKSAGKGSKPKKFSFFYEGGSNPISVNKSLRQLLENAVV